MGYFDIDINRIHADELFEVAEELLNKQKLVEITITGNSMYPFMRHLRDSVILEKTFFDQIKKLDIILVKKHSGQYILHRVCKKGKVSFVMLGDAQTKKEYFNRSDCIIAKVTKIKRENTTIICNHFFWLALSYIWLKMRLFRPFFLKLLRVLPSRYRGTVTERRIE